MPDKIDTSFIANFKLGDNIKFNLECISALYKKLDTKWAAERKPIILLNTCVIESLMIDFVRRVKIHTREFTYLDEPKRKAIRGFDSDKKHWNFDSSINKFRHYQLLGNSEDFYRSLKHLKELRNRIHIHNTVFDPDECNVWKPKALHASEACLEYTARYLSHHYPRRIVGDFVGGFTLPWAPHFADGEDLKWVKIGL